MGRMCLEPGVWIKCWEVVGDEAGRVVEKEMVQSLGTSSQARSPQTVPTHAHSFLCVSVEDVLWPQERGQVSR